MKMIAIAVLLAASTLGASTVGAVAQGQNGRFCYVGRDGSNNCGFQTRAQCEAARKGITSDVCTRNPQSGSKRAR